MAISVLGTPNTDVDDGASYAPEAGSDRAVIWLIGSRASVAAEFTGATYDAVAMALDVVYNRVGAQVTRAIAVNSQLEADLPGGSAIIDGTWTQTVDDQQGAALTLAGVHQTTPVVDTSTVDVVGAGSTSADMPALTVSAGGMVVLIIQAANSIPDVPAGYTDIFTVPVGADDLRCCYRLIESDGTENITLTQANEGILIGAAVAYAPASGAVTLVVADAVHGHSAASPALTQANTLALQNAAHGHLADSPALTQAHVLAADDAAHGHSADSVTLSSGATLLVAEATHGHLADTVALVQAHVLAVQDALHAHGVDSITLSVASLLEVADALHAHGADNVVLSQAGVLVVADALHGHSAGNLALVQAHILAVADAVHGHLADELALIQDSVLELADTLHLHAADQLVLTQAHVLVVSSALHQHLADSLSLELGGFVNDPGRVFVVESPNRTLKAGAEKRTFVVARGRRTFNA